MFVVVECLCTILIFSIFTLLYVHICVFLSVFIYTYVYLYIRMYLRTTLIFTSVLFLVTSGLSTVYSEVTKNLNRIRSTRLPWCRRGQSSLV